MAYDQLPPKDMRSIREAYRASTGEGLPSNWRRANRVPLGWRIFLACVGNHPELGIDAYPLPGAPMADHAAYAFQGKYHPIEDEL